MSDFCRYCGAELKPGAKFCGKCGKMQPSDRYEEGPFGRHAGKYRDENRMPQGIALSAEEKPVRQYTIGRYTLRQGAIDVIVTNKRVIRYEKSSRFGMQTHQLDEISIRSIQGISCCMKRSISILGLGVGLALLILAFTVFSTAFAPLAAIPLLAAIAILANSFRPSMFFSVRGLVGGYALQTEVNMLGRIFGNNRGSVVFQFKPTPETTTMLQELGACIADLQTMGDEAIGKWTD